MVAVSIYYTATIRYKFFKKVKNMKFKDIINDLKVPFIISIADEKFDVTKVQLIVPINGEDCVGHRIRNIDEDIYNIRPEVLEYDVETVAHVRDFFNTYKTPAIKLTKNT